MTDLKSCLETQETKTQKADTKFKFSISEQEKLKKEFETKKKAWADEKTALINRAEKAEAALEEATGELSGLKRHISNMTQAIFGKLYLTLQSYPLPWANSLMLTYRLFNPRLESRQSAR